MGASISQARIAGCCASCRPTPLLSELPWAISRPRVPQVFMGRLAFRQKKISFLFPKLSLIHYLFSAAYLSILIKF
jgi:hypothetical protein